MGFFNIVTIKNSKVFSFFKITSKFDFSYKNIIFSKIFFKNLAFVIFNNIKIYLL